MRFRSQAVSTVLIQGTGAAAALTAVALLGYFLGPALQGTFSQVKVEVEFVGALAMLGLPQALFFFVHSRRMSLGRAKRLSVVAAAIGGVIATAAVLRWSSWSPGRALMFLSAAAAFTWHGCLRGIVLSVTDSRSFNIVTAVPQGMLLLYAAIACLLGVVTEAQVGFAFTVSFATAVLLGIHWLTRRQTETQQNGIIEEPIGNVLKYGVASGISSIGTSLTVLFAIRAVRSRYGAEAVGVFTLALTLAQGVLVPLNYVIPLLFKRWVEIPTLRAPLIAALGAGVSFTVLAFAVKEVTQRLPGVGEWAGQYVSTLELLWILLLATAADAIQRIVAVAANARGLPWLPATSEVLRVSVFAACLAGGYASGLHGLAWLVCIASTVACATLFASYLISAKRAI